MAVNEKYVLTIDCGTQSIRGLVFDRQGKLELKIKEEIEPYFSLQPGWTEQDPDLYYNTMCTIIKRLRDDNGDIYKKIQGITVTTQRDCCIVVDKEGKPLRPAILWMDQREASQKAFKLPYKVATKVVGMHDITKKIGSHCKAHWLKEHEKDIWDRTHKYLMLSAYLNFKLTGKYVDSIASTIGHVPFNYKKFRWDSELGLKSQIFHIEKDKLYDIVEPGTIIGNVTEEVAEATGLRKGLPIIASASDKGCETLGVGCVDNETVSLSMGSHATIQTTTKKYYELQKFIPPFPAAIPRTYNPELQIYRGYWMVTWFKKEFSKKEMEEAKRKGIAPEVLLNNYLNEIPPGSDGVILQPYWGPPIKMPEAKGSIIGFSDYHTRIHIYRAIIEGIAYGLFAGMKSIEKHSGVEIKRVMLSGGSSQSDAICQITADVFNKPVYRVQTYETSGLGAAIISFVGLGIYKDYDEAVKHMVHIKDNFTPIKDNVSIYHAIYHQVYKNIYKRMRPLYHELKQIYKARRKSDGEV